MPFTFRVFPGFISRFKISIFPYDRKKIVCGAPSAIPPDLPTAAERVLLGGIPARILLSAGVPLMTKTLHAAGLA